MKASHLTGRRAVVLYQHETIFEVGTPVIIVSYDEETQVAKVLGNVQGIHTTSSIDLDLLGGEDLEQLRARDVKPKRKRRTKKKKDVEESSTEIDGGSDSGDESFSEGDSSVDS